MVSFTITPLTDHTGTEVIGLDFTQPIDIETRATLSRYDMRERRYLYRLLIASCSRARCRSDGRDEQRAKYQRWKGGPS